MTEVQTIAFPNEWYEANSEDHFWFQWRARAANALTRRVGLPTGLPLNVLDIGCGTGITCRQFNHTTEWIFDGADLNVDALTRCDGAMRRVLYYDILEKRPELQEQYDLIFLFDVLEHIEHTKPFLQATLFHLKPGGVILINVPALMALYSAYDTAVHHYRRYTTRTLAQEFESFDVSVAAQMYWGFSALPLLWLRQQWLRGQTNEDQTVRTGFRPPSPAAHALLRALMKVETTVLKRPPLGTSVMAAIRKNR
jgi:SAM-dependent methyltransferase